MGKIQRFLRTAEGKLSVRLRDAGKTFRVGAANTIRWLISRRTIGNFALLVIIGTAVSSLWWFPKIQVHDVVSLEKRIELEDKNRQTLAQILGAISLGIYFTYRNLKVSEDKQLTERYSKSLEQLGMKGEENIFIRLGAIHALKRIANDSSKDHWTIMELLALFIQEDKHRQFKKLRLSDDDSETGEKKLNSNSEFNRIKSLLQKGSTNPRYSSKVIKIEEPEAKFVARALAQPFKYEVIAPDIQEALNAICSRSYHGDPLSEKVNLKDAILLWSKFSKRVMRIDFSSAIMTHSSFEEGCLLEDLSFKGAFVDSAKFNQVNLVNIDFNSSSLWRTDFKSSRLRKVKFKRAFLIRVAMNESTLTDVDFGDAVCWRAIFRGAIFINCNFTWTDLTAAVFSGADLSRVDETLTQAQIDLTYGDETTKLPPHLKMPDHWVRESTKALPKPSEASEQAKDD